MRFVSISLLFILPIGVFAQTTEELEKKEVTEVIQLFFDSLKKQDTVLLKKSAYIEGQVWTLRKAMGSNAEIGMRYLRADMNSFDTRQQLLETPLRFDIKLHRGMAMAWVPYEFMVNGNFSHCGVDAFTLMKTNEQWKIVSIAYTVELDDCDTLKE